MNQVEVFLNKLNQIQQQQQQQEDKASQHVNAFANYLLNLNDESNSNGWLILKLIHENKLTINEILGEKLINLLINICGQLILDNKYNDTKSQHNELIYLNLFDWECKSSDVDLTVDVNKCLYSYNLRLSSSRGNLIDLIIICLSLFIRFNDGANTSILAEQMTKSESSNVSVLNDFADVLFNKMSADSHGARLVQFIYLKFLNKMFKLNFRNLNKQNLLSMSNSSTSLSKPRQQKLHQQHQNSFKQPSNALFLQQFRLICDKLKLNETKSYFLRLVVNYLHSYATSIHFLSDTNDLSQSKTFNTTLAVNVIAFESLTHLLHQTHRFLFNNLLLLDDDLSEKNFDVNKYEEANQYWSLLTRLLAEMKQFKCLYQHAQTCLRAKHTHSTCKLSLSSLSSTHSDLTMLNQDHRHQEKTDSNQTKINVNACLFSLIIECLFNNLTKEASKYYEMFSLASTNSSREFNDKNRLGFTDRIKLNRLINLIQTMGICTCICLDDLLEMQRFKLKEADNQYFFVNQNELNSILFEYLFFNSIKSSKNHSIASPEATQAAKIPKKRSIFFPLLMDESLVKSKSSNLSTINSAQQPNQQQHQKLSSSPSLASLLVEIERTNNDDSNNNDLFKKYYEILCKSNEKSVFLVKLLALCLNKYTKYLPGQHAHNSQSSQSESASANSIDTANSDVNTSLKYKWMIHELFYLFKNVIDNLTATKLQTPSAILVFEMICKYFSEFLILTNSSSASSQRDDVCNSDTLDDSVHGSTGGDMSISATSTASSNFQQIELKINEKFIKFLSDNSIKLYETVSSLAMSNSNVNSNLTNLSLSLCCQLILFKQSTTIELHLSKSLIDTAINSTVNTSSHHLLKSYIALDIFVELYVRCSTFRQCLNESHEIFHLSLYNSLMDSFKNLNESEEQELNEDSFNSTLSEISDMEHKYLEILLDLIFVYYYYNRKKDLNDIYALMKLNLNKNTHLLITYLNVTILSKAFKLNKLLLLNNYNSKLRINGINVNDNDSMSLQLDMSSIQLSEQIKKTPIHVKHENDAIVNSSNLNDYDADIEFSLQDGLSTTTPAPLVKGQSITFNSNANKYRYDLILFPRILEICLSHLTQLRHTQLSDLNRIASLDDAVKFQIKYSTTTSSLLVIQQFFKRLVYLLESCNFNIQILNNNHFRQYFIDFINKPNINYNLSDLYHEQLNGFFKVEHQIIENCFEVLYFVSLYDMNESFLDQLFKLIISNSTSQSLIMRELSSNLLLKLATNLKQVHSTHFLRMPIQNHLQEQPIDYLLDTTISSALSSSNNSKKWKVNLNYEPATNDSTSSSPTSATKQAQMSSQNSDTSSSTTTTSTDAHLSRMIKESAQKICSLRIPLSKPSSPYSNQQLSNSASSPSSLDATGQASTRHSYSIAFMLRFDDNLVNFSKSYGLHMNSTQQKHLNNSSGGNSHDVYAHLFSVNLDNESSSFEIWINSNGNLLFIRRSDHLIIITFNLFQISSNAWHFIYVNYDEEHLKSINKLNCKISYSLNAAEMIDKEFEIFCSPNRPINRSAGSNQTQSLYFFIGHQEKKSNVELNHLFHYDLGQVILSKDCNYSLEHLIMLMQIMDTNISLLERLSEYEWDYLNGYSDVKLIDNLHKNFNEYCDWIKSKIICVYHPKNSHTAVIKYPSSPRQPMTHVDVIASNGSKSFTQSTFDIVLNRTGGIRQILILIAKLVEDENKLFNALNISQHQSNSNVLDNNNNNRKILDNKYSSLVMLETLIHLLNKRAHIQMEFKQLDGYVLLQRIFTSIASLNRYTLMHKQLANDNMVSSYYESIKKSLFIILINGCFRRPVFYMNLYSNENLDFCINLSNQHVNNNSNIDLNESYGAYRIKKANASIGSNNSIYLININLLAKVIIEWSLWSSTSMLTSVSNGNNLWRYIFQILNKLLENVNSSQLYHSSLFYKYNLHEKLIHFLLDANEENCLFDVTSCQSLISIFKNFNLIRSMSDKSQRSVVNTANAITKQLFANFFDYLNVLHAENRAYIVYATKDFYYNLTLSLPSIPYSSMQDVARHRINKSTSSIKKVPSQDASSSGSSTGNGNEEQKQVPTQMPQPSLKRQIITLDRFQSNENETNFSQISAGLMEIMYEMLVVLPDSMVNEILNLLKFESFIMFAMDENQDKRFGAFRLFLTLIERSSTMSFLITSSLATVASAANAVAVAASTNPTSLLLSSSQSSQSLSRTLMEQQNWNANKEYLIYAMCNQLNQYDQLDERMAEFCIKVILNQQGSTISFKKNWPLDPQLIKSQSNQILYRLNYIYLLVSLLYSSRKNMPLCQNCLSFLYSLLDLDIVKIDFLIVKAGFLQVLINLLRFYSDETNYETIITTTNKMKSYPSYYSSPKSASNQTNNNSNNNDLPIINDLKNFFSLINRSLLRFNENQDADNFSYFINTLVSLCYDSSNIGYEKLNYNLKTIILNIVQSIMNDLNSISTIQETAPKASILLKKIIAPLISTSSKSSETNAANSNIIPSFSTLGAAFLSTSSSAVVAGLQSLSQSAQLPPATSLFDNDMRFQKFLIFIVDFIHIVYDKISDMPSHSLSSSSSSNIKDISYDINDELAIFSFAILIHCLSIGLENNSKTKFSSLFKSNLTFIRIQFRRLFIFMLHPNHKLQTRLQIIKRLLNTPNCELIIKSIITLSDTYQHATVYTNIKLAFYLNALMNLTNSTQSHHTKGHDNINKSDNQATATNNDKEILNHLNYMLANAGLNYKNELNTFLSNMSRTNNLNMGMMSNVNNASFVSDFSDLIEPTYLLIQNTSSSLQLSAMHARRVCIDLMNQYDKELDDQRVNFIYRRANDTFKLFLSQFDKLTSDLNSYSINLLNQVVQMHSNVRKIYLQRLKNKRIELYDVKQKWLYLIENMTHERCVLNDKKSLPGFFILDQIESPLRERRRLKKSHLYIAERFFKEECKSKLLNEKAPQQLRYLLNNYHDMIATSSMINKNNYGADQMMTNANEANSSSTAGQLNDNNDDADKNSDANSNAANTSSSSMGDYMLYHLKNSEVIKYPCSCRNVMPYCEIKGELLLSEQRIYFAADEKNYIYLMGIENVTYSWSYDDIKEIHLRRYLLKDVGLELFLIFGHTILLAFDDTKERNSIYKAITAKNKSKNIIKSESIDEATQMWRESKMSNYEYLMQLNKYSGRTFNDLMQYPIYPHILSNYSSNTLDLACKENYRDLSKPIPIQCKEKEEKFLQNYNMLQESSSEAYHYASLYSNSGTVLHYLVRLPPFTKMFLDYQDQNFDVPDRTFHSVNTSWLLLSSTEATTDYKELIPEFFFLHEFLTNKQGFNFGVRQNGEGIDNVALPPWSKQNPRLFVSVMRQALESNYVTCNLNYWIDLIFGYKQSGRAALEAINLYHPACYFGYPVEQISDPVHRKAIETMIKTWGQTPKQIFTAQHSQSLLVASLSKRSQLTSSMSIQSIPTNASNITTDASLIFNPKSSNPNSSNSIHRLIFNVKWGWYVGSLDQLQQPVCVYKETCKKNIFTLISLYSNDMIALAQHKCLLNGEDRGSGSKDSSGGLGGMRLFGSSGSGISSVGDMSSNTSSMTTALIEWGSYDDYIKIKLDNDKPAINLIPIRSNEHNVVCVNCVGSNYIVIGEKSGLLSVYKLKKEKLLIQCESFNCHLYGHKQEITDISVCLSFSTMITSSQDGLLIIWDTNKFSYVNSLFIKSQYIYKVSISETTNDFAFICNTPNRLYFYTGNCELIGETDATPKQMHQESTKKRNDASQIQDDVDLELELEQQLSEENVINMKSLCFSNQTEGLNVNVIAVGLSNGKIRLHSTWDLTLLREITINYDSLTNIGCIISLAYTRDGKRLIASDTYSRVYILEAYNSPASLAKASFNASNPASTTTISSSASFTSSTSLMLTSSGASSSNASLFFTNLTCFT